MNFRNPPAPCGENELRFQFIARLGVHKEVARIGCRVDRHSDANSSGVYICKSIVNYSRHRNFICKSEGIYLAQARGGERVPFTPPRLPNESLKTFGLSCNM